VRAVFFAPALGAAVFLAIMRRLAPCPFAFTVAGAFVLVLVFVLAPETRVALILVLESLVLVALALVALVLVAFVFAALVLAPETRERVSEDFDGLARREPAEVLGLERR